MYVLDRNSVIIEKRVGMGPGEVDVYDEIYTFELKECFNDKFLYEISKTVQRPGFLNGGPSVPQTFNVMINRLHELDKIRNNPEAAFEFFEQEAMSKVYMYFELKTPYNDKPVEIHTKEASFNDYVKNKSLFKKINHTQPFIFEKRKSSEIFAFDNGREDQYIYKGYAFLLMDKTPREFYENNMKSIDNKIEALWGDDYNVH